MITVNQGGLALAATYLLSKSHFTTETSSEQGSMLGPGLSGSTSRVFAIKFCCKDLDM